jgi:macrolide transport system ATP-binding/permease protein
MTESLISVENLKFSYFQESREVPVLNGLSFEIKAGEFVAIQGSSGSGKSTLLYLLGGMNPVQSGRVSIAGVDLAKMSNEEAALFRNRFIGFIFQQFHLLPRATVLENVLLPVSYPLEMPSIDPQRADKAEALLASLGLAELKNNGPQQLSGGQQQRVAVARALVNEAPLILADEPTGNLDSTNATAVMDLLKELNRQGKTVVLITHDSQLAKEAGRIITLKDGLIISDSVKHSAALPSTETSEIKSRWSALKKEFHQDTSNHFFLSIVQAALTNLFKSRLRSWLTMVGVSIGIAAILTTLTLGEFTKEKILSSYAELGVRTIQFYGYPNWDQKATDRVTNVAFSGFNWDTDLKNLPVVFPEVKRLAPVLTDSATSLGFGGKTIEEQSRIYGISEESLNITQLPLSAGSPFSKYHIDHKSNVCIIGSEVIERLFTRTNPLGQILMVSEQNKSFSCKIIGALKPRSTRSEFRNPNLELYVPYTYLQAMATQNWNTRITQVLMELHEDVPIESTGRGIRAFFERKYGSSGKFRMDSDTLLIEQMNRFLNVFSGFLAALAVVSLAVGGIGITNMMLVSISERFREIGLRKALGATDLSLRWQLLMESVLLCGLAGFVGIVSGFTFYEIIIWGATRLIPKLTFEWVFIPWAFAFSSVSIVGVGVLSGVIPALRAEKLSSMEALRYE